MDNSSFLAPPHPVIVGHRGDPARHRENSLAGIIAGLGADGAVELDARLTADGHLVLSHDPDFGGLTVAQTSWSELAGLDERPSLLDEAVSIPGRLDIEIKNSPLEPGFDDRGLLARMVASRARPGDIVTSFYWPDLTHIRQSRASVATGLLVAEGGSAPDALLFAAGAGHALVAAHDSLIDEALVGKASRIGVSIAAWTVNDLARARDLSRWGVAAIISDHPHAIVAALGPGRVDGRPGTEAP